MRNRKTNLKTIWQRAKIRPILLLSAFQGITFSLLLFLPLTLMMNSFKSSFPYVENVEKIESSGTNESAVLTEIEPIENVTINGNNPTILTYKFDLNGQIIHSRFSVFDPIKIKNLKIGDVIPIKQLNGNSIVLGFEQYSFSMDFMKYIAGAAMLVGLVFFCLLFLRIKKEIDLYKMGKLKEGKIISINQNKGFTFSKFGSSMDVYYEYDVNGTKEIGKSRTNNFALTNNKTIGDTVRILVSEDGKNSCLYPELIAKMNHWKEN
ncbi:hypothetical protein [Aquimarina rubra]|uniref:DUF3592 domain-containing protein n=1 Tax=Aquimarina rubra TaxID=1920033 RepID=A0ABW5LCH4_9FLAO